MVFRFKNIVIIISLSLQQEQSMKYRLCKTTEIPEHGCKEFSLTTKHNELSLFIVHKDDQLYAYKNNCPHTGASLNWQQDQFLDLDNSFIQCSIHNALFEIDSGYCIAGPCSGSSLHELDLNIQDNEIYLVI